MEKITMKKRIAYDYLFNYFGGDTHDGRIVSGASISLNIRAYKDGKEVLFEEDKEVRIYKHYLSDVFEVSFDRENQFVVKKNFPIDRLFRIVHEWDRIEAEVIESYLVVDCELVAVSEQEFREFLKARKDDFDIIDNVAAQVPSVSFYDQEAVL